MDVFYQTVCYILFGLVGLCVGSFLNVVIYRLPLGMGLDQPPSHCPVCGHKLSWKDNIPLLSFLLLGGRCRYCGTKISPRYFFVEALNCLLWLAVYAEFGPALPYAICACLFCSALVCAGFCDEENLFIPDPLQAFILLTGLAFLFFAPSEWENRLFGFLLGGGFYLLFYLGSWVILRKEGLGFGDVKLMAACGLFLGWEKIALTIVVGSLLAVLMLFVKGWDAKREYPLAPALTAASVLVLLLGEPILSHYLLLFA